MRVIKENDPCKMPKIIEVISTMDNKIYRCPTKEQLFGFIDVFGYEYNDEIIMPGTGKAIHTIYVRR